MIRASCWWLSKLLAKNKSISDLLAYCPRICGAVIAINALQPVRFGKTSQIVIAMARLLKPLVNGLCPPTTSTIRQLRLRWANALAVA